MAADPVFIDTNVLVGRFTTRTSNAADFARFEDEIALEALVS